MPAREQNPVKNWLKSAFFGAKSRKKSRTVFLACSSEKRCARPPDVETRRAALAGDPDRNLDFSEQVENSESTTQFQARSLRQRYALAHYLAVTVAPLAWGGLPR
jgi:hypothetical protein